MSIEAINPVLTIPHDTGETASNRRGLSAAGESAKGQSSSRIPGEDTSPVEEQDRVSLSPEARALADRAGSAETAEGADPEAPAEGDERSDGEDADEAGELSERDHQLVEKLEARDREVRTHEAAHLVAAGPYAQGGAHFDYQTGPDGKRYAVGGHVNIDIAAVAGDPQATIDKSEQVRRAALAPADPSAKDRQVASRASAAIAKAQAELRSDPSASNEITTTPSEQGEQTESTQQGEQSESTPQAERGTRKAAVSGYGSPAGKIDPAGQYLDLSA